MMLFSCSKDPLYTPPFRKSLHFYFQSTRPYTIHHGHFRLQLMASIPSPSGKGSQNILVKEKYYWRNTLPFDVTLAIKASRIDSFEALKKEKHISYYLRLHWDSDGNGKMCQGDLGFDYQICIPEITISERRQKLYLKEKPGQMNCP